ncbi:MAG TPA: hypothetical protein VFY87_23725 [Geminicoccaceae bacterium]|nr:hypothetical protein [Geminicoccaceae bacterium]
MIQQKPARASSLPPRVIRLEDLGSPAGLGLAVPLGFLLWLPFLLVLLATGRNLLGR